MLRCLRLWKMAAVLEKLSTPLTGTSLLQCEEELSKSQNSPVKCISLLDPFLSNHLFSLSDYLLSEAVQHKIRAHTHSPAQISWQRWRFGPAQFATHKIMKLFLKFSTKWNWWTVGKYLMRSICPLVDFCHTPHTIQQRNTLSPTAVGDIVCYRA